MSALSQLLQEAIQQKIFPGCAAAVIPLDDAVEPLEIFAGARTEAALSPVTAETIFDLASLTKIMCTTILMAQSQADGRLSFNDCPFPNWPGIELQHLLAHNSGLADWNPFFENVPPEHTGLPPGYEHIVEQVLSTMPQKPVTHETLYSDLGFIALGHYLTQVHQTPLNVLYEAWCQKNLPQSEARFVSLTQDGFHPHLNRVAPTAQCPWRKRRLHGQVHDDNCFTMGGVSGHAGLFGRLEDVAVYGRWLGQTLQATNPVGEALRNMVAATFERPLGFDRPTPGGSTGEAISPKAIGHLGFTGTSFWLDPGDAAHPGAIYILLTNRVYYDDNLEAFKKIRRRFHQEATTYLTHSFREKNLRSR